MKNVNTIRKKLAGGITEVYRYHRPTGVKLTAEPETTDFQQQLAALEDPIIANFLRNHVRRVTRRGPDGQVRTRLFDTVTERWIDCAPWSDEFRVIASRASLRFISGINTVHRRLASGEVKTYRYHRASKRPLSADVIAAAAEARNIAQQHAAAPTVITRRARPRKRPASLVYFIQRGETGPIKIGLTTNLERRLAALQTACAEPLMVVAVGIGPATLERQLHKELADLRLEGEWFTPDQRVFQAAERVAQQPSVANQGSGATVKMAFAKRRS